MLARIPARLVDESRKTVPSEFLLYDLPGEPRLNLGGDRVYFHPLSMAMNVWDPETERLRPPVGADLVKFIQVAEGLPHVNTLASTFYCNDVVPEVVDAYRMYLLLKYATKPFVTGGFTVEGQHVMNDMARAFRGGAEALAAKPMVIMSSAPSAPLEWGFTADLLLIGSEEKIPMLISPMPIPGLCGPMTLIGSIVQNTAEALSGVVLSQLVRPGAPILLQTGISILDMRGGQLAFGGIELLMANCGAIEVSKYLDMPTMASMGLSDSKTVDAQQAIESTAGTLLAALCRVNLVCGMGMMDSMAAHSCESLVISHDAVGMAHRLLDGINDEMESLGLDIIREVGHAGNFLETEHTLRWFKKESYFPALIDRQAEASWAASGAKDMLQRARERVEELVASYTAPVLPADVEQEIDDIMGRYAAKYGMKELPDT
jgi:trimethylamine--corrinoid protein Co-methyltransferase